MDEMYYTLCAEHVHSLTKAVAGKGVQASPSCQSSLIPLCLLASAEVGQGGLRHPRHCHPVVRGEVAVSKPRRD